MRLIQMKLTNFRCYKDETVIDLDDLVVFVGKNDSGKSSLFDALDIFFENKAAPDKDDACIHTDDATVRIACVFGELPSQLVIDAQYPTDLTSEHLLNGDGHLEIVKVYNCNLAKPKCSGVYARAAHPTADGYADLLSLTNAKLKQRASSLGVNLDNVNQTVNTALRRAIWEHAEDLQCHGVDVELKAEVQEIANHTVEKIREMNPELASELTPRVSNKSWDTLFSVNLTGDEGIPINKRGSGTRRLVLLNFFRAKAEKEAEGNSTGLIYAIEEPETSQHPHNQVMLVRALEELSERAECQVFLSTHTPVLARRFAQNSLRLVTQEGGRPVIRHGRDASTIKEIVESLGVLPDHNVKVFFGVEGRNDINFLRTISKILLEAGEDIVDLGLAEDSGHLVFVPLGGSSLDLWVSRLKGFNRPEFYLMDRDTEPPAEPHYKALAEQICERDNCTAWHTGKRELENYIHPDVIKHDYPEYAGVGVEFEDVPTLFAQAVHEASGSGVPWAAVISDPEKLKKKVSNAKKRLNTEFMAKMTSELLTAVDPNGDVRGWLKEVGAALNEDGAPG